MKNVTIAILLLIAIVGGTIAAALFSPVTEGAGFTYVYNWTATNKIKLGTVTLTKVDDLGNPVSGAQFTLSCVALAYTNTQTTPASGLLTWANLKWGDYVLTEDIVPEGYTADIAFPKSFHIGK